MIKIDWHPPDHQLRQFGWFALVGFPMFGWVAHARLGAPEWVLWTLVGVGVTTLGLSRIRAGLVKPIFLAMMLIALPIGFVLSFVLMALIYYGLFTPVGLAMRLFGRDTMHKRPDPAVESYWHVRGAPRAAADYYKLY